MRGTGGGSVAAQIFERLRECHDADDRVLVFAAVLLAPLGNRRDVAERARTGELKREHDPERRARESYDGKRR